MSAVSLPPVEDDAADVDKLRSVDKALKLMDAFVGGSQHLGLSAISRRTGIPKSTTHRLLHHLEAAGFVERVGTDYRIGEKVFLLGTLARPHGFDALRNEAMPHLSELFVRTRLSVCLGTLHGSSVRIEVKIQPDKGFRPPKNSGDHISATSTSLGKAILAFGTADVIRETLSAPLPRHTKYSMRDPDVLLAELRETRERGFALDRQESRLGQVSMALPVRVNGTVVAAISATGPSASFDSALALRELTHAADQTGRSFRELMHSL